MPLDIDAASRPGSAAGDPHANDNTAAPSQRLTIGAHPSMSETVKVIARDYEQLSAELIRAWRGPRTLAAFSRRLGSRSSSLVQNWEAKRRWPTAARALWCAERAGVDVCEALAKFYGRPPS